MCAKWRKGAEEKCKPLLQRLNGIERYDNGFRGIETLFFHSYFATLGSYIEFDSGVGRFSQKKIIVNAIRAFATTKKEITANTLIQNVRKYEKELFSVSPKEYHIFTTIQLPKNWRIRKRTINGVKISFYKRQPKKYCFGSVEEELKTLYSPVDLPRKYSSVVLSVKGYNEQWAYEEASKALALLRGVWNVLLGSGTRQTYKGRVPPLSAISEGPIYSVHTPDGQLSNNCYFYDPDYRCEFGCRNKSEKALENEKEIFGRLKQFAPDMRQFVEDAIVQYTEALDLWNSELSIIRLWSMLEYMSCSLPGESHVKIVNKLSSLFIDKDCAEMMLTHLKNTRNRVAHSHFSPPDPEAICGQLKTYCRELILYLICHGEHFNSKREYGDYLKLPAKKDDLERNIRLSKLALEYKGAEASYS
ncbi:MAG: hypothetical protein PVH19_11980 [Planctomycetia bacterium]|jgi:hypothetical protein